MLWQGSCGCLIFMQRNDTCMLHQNVKRAETPDGFWWRDEIKTWTQLKLTNYIWSENKLKLAFIRPLMMGIFVFVLKRLRLYLIFLPTQLCDDVFSVILLTFHHWIHNWQSWSRIIRFYESPGGIRYNDIMGLNGYFQAIYIGYMEFEKAFYFLGLIKQNKTLPCHVAIQCISSETSLSEEPFVLETLLFLLIRNM